MRIRWILPLILLIAGSCQNITEPQQNSPIVVFTFDDQHQSIYQTAFPILEEYDFPATNFVNSPVIGNPNFLSWEQLEILEKNEGWETGGHTLHHINMPDYTPEVVEYEIAQDQQNLLAHDLDAVSFALPSGHATPQQFEIIAKYYRNIRTSLDIEHTAPVNRKLLGYYAFYSSYTAADVKSRIVRGIQNKEALIILGFHRVTVNTGDYPTNCPPAAFAEIVKFVHKTDLRVMTLREALSEVCED
jgi:peptidoglycan/xylan/chitin deacetylase (PgdA/CDA1 family)